MQLSLLQLSSLLEEIASMVAARRPIAAGLSELNGKSMGQIGAAARQISQQLQSGMPPADAVASVSGGLAPVSRVAMQCVTRTGTTDPIYHLAAMLRRRHERHVRATVAKIYPAVTMLIAYLVASFGVSTLLIQMVENQLVFLPIPPWLETAARFLQEYFWVPLVIFAAAWLVAGLRARWGQGHGDLPLLFTKKTEALTNWASFCEMLAIATESGFAFDEAVEVAADSTAGGKWRSDVQPTIDAVRSGAIRLDDHSSLLPPLLHWRLSRLADGQTNPPNAHELRNLAHWYHLRSQRRWQFWSEWFPMISALVMMTVLILAMCLLVVKPIYDLS
tara:strand:- start:8669 stop:9667 length:999 start_codon:yes stop_codon:yes gene_type:complete